MSQSNTIVFAFSDTGGGHRSAAIAISAALDETEGAGVSCEMVDVLRATNVPGIRNAPNLYDKLSTRWLPLYDFSFQLTNGVRRVDAISRVLYIQARRNLARSLIARNPRLIVVTHPLVHRLVCAVRRAYRLPIQVVTVVTDLVTLHASWTFPGVDLCMVPTAEAYNLMLQRGMHAERMVRTGFPVHPKFARYSASKEESRAALELAAERFTILVTGGGVGSGNLLELATTLERTYPDHQILVITGKNRALYDQLRMRVRHPHFKIYGFVDNMEQLMAASDVVVTKAGPGTLMEALVMQRPVLVTEAVGMQERGNIDFVLNHELGAYCPTIERIVEAVEDLALPEHYAPMAERLKHAVPRDGAHQIASLVLDRLGRAPVPAMRRRPRRLLSLVGLRSWSSRITKRRRGRNY